jgi:hypothetical protein
MIYRQSVVIVAIGLGFGLALALLVARAVTSFVTVSVWDPLSWRWQPSPPAIFLPGMRWQ